MPTSSLAQDLSEHTPISISVGWSGKFLEAGQGNAGTMTIKSTSPGHSIDLANGDIVKLEVFGEGGWTFSASDPSQWAVTDHSVTSRSVYYFTYQGSTDLAVRAMTEMFTAHSLAGDQDGSSPLAVGMTITPPSGASAPNIRVQLLDAEEHPLSFPQNFPVNYVKPGDPLVTFADAPMAVLLTGSDATNFPNAISCTLLNNSSSSITSGTLTLSLVAMDSSGNPVSITQDLKHVTVGGGLDWTYDSTYHTWTTTLSGTLSSHEEKKVSITDLVLTASNIATLEASIEVQGVGSHATYPTVARFQAFGPYTLALSLDTDQSNAKFYTFSDPGTGTYDINPINSDLNVPPLAPQLLDSDGHAAYPPIGGYFSWNGTSPDFPSGYPLTTGSNPLYYLLPAANDTYSSLTTCTAKLDFYPQTVQAKSFEQAYMASSGTKFGPIMPPGTILMWSGTNVPDGWALCDGTAVSGSQLTIPDLRDKFIMGAGGSEVVNSQHAADTHTHDITINNTFTTTQDGTHDHNMPNWNGYNCSSGDTGVLQSEQTSTTADAGKHDHTVTVTFTNAPTGTNVGSVRPSWYALCFIIRL